MNLLILSMAFAANLSMQEVKNKLGFTNSTYEKVSGDCTEDFAKIEYEQDEDNIIVRIGERIVFPELGKESWTVDSGKNCKDIKSNKISKGKIYTEIRHECKNKSNSFQIQSSLEETDSNLNLTITKTYSNKKKNTDLKCSYKVAKVENK